MIKNVITVKNLSKFYGKFQALKNISFEVPEGCVFTVVGPNGAGKTTTIEILEGIRNYDEGEISILNHKMGLKSGSKIIKENIGVQLQDGSLMDNLKPLEIATLYRSFYSKGYDPLEAIKIVDLEYKKNTLIKNLSGGEYKRLQIALAIINKPKIIFLDEPTTGLDPVSRRKLWEIILKFKKQRKTIILTTHYMDEAEKLSDIVLILNKGSIISMDTPSNLISNSNIKNKIILTIKKEFTNNSNLKMLEIFFEKESINSFIKKGNSYIIYINSIETFLEKLFPKLKKLLIELENLFVIHPSLEDVFLLKTGEFYTNGEDYEKFQNN